jgi:hypothetical protein
MLHAAQLLSAVHNMLVAHAIRLRSARSNLESTSRLHQCLSSLQALLFGVLLLLFLFYTFIPLIGPIILIFMLIITIVLLA